MIVGNMVRQVDSMNVGSLLHFFGCEVNSLVRSNALGITMIVDKAF